MQYAPDYLISIFLHLHPPCEDLIEHSHRRSCDKILEGTYIERFSNSIGVQR